MFSTLDIDIRPGSGLGRFEIGASLWTILDLLRTQPHSFPQLEVKHDPGPDASTTSPIIIHARPHLDLLFSGKHQRLHTICVRRLHAHPPVVLRYNGAVLAAREEPLTRVGVRRAFGPTYPGDELRYPGLWFSFEDDAGAGEPRPAPAPADDRAQEVRRVMVSLKENDGRCIDALDEVGELPIMAGDIRQAVVKVRGALLLCAVALTRGQVHRGVTLYFYPASARPVHIALGETTAQDLTLDLGPPIRVHHKEDERMSIHAVDSPAEAHDEPRCTLRCTYPPLISH
ncbi:hypothetical protein C0992_005586 [Termitomyces sp. T32_za158]|nr:hypothetical protein C0992_005586 [Termitomyces sp. T32_za158]